MIQERYAHLQNNRWWRLMGQQLLKHINQCIMHLFWIKLQQLYNIQLLEALNQLLCRFGIFFKNKWKKVYHFPNEVWHLECVKQSWKLRTNHLKCFQVVNLRCMNVDTHWNVVVLWVVDAVVEVKQITFGSSSKRADAVHPSKARCELSGLGIVWHFEPIVYLFEHFMDATSLLIYENIIRGLIQILQNEVKVVHKFGLRN